MRSKVKHKPFGTGIFGSAMVWLALIGVGGLLALVVAGTLASRVVLAEPTYTVVVAPESPSNVIDLENLAYSDAKAITSGVTGGSTIDVPFTVDPSLGEVTITGATLAFDDVGSVITYSGKTVLFSETFGAV